MFDVVLATAINVVLSTQLLLMMQHVNGYDWLVYAYDMPEGFDWCKKYEELCFFFCMASTRLPPP